MNILARLSLTLALIASASLAHAKLIAPTPVAAEGRLANLSIFSQKTGRLLPVWAHEGRFYVEGTPDERYAVRIKNKKDQRILAVVAVDGVNVLNGKTAQTKQTGYVLNATDDYDIPGWRKSNDEVAAFYFTALPDSYAARTGRPDNVGVISAVIFAEYVAPAPVISRENASMDRKRPLNGKPVTAGEQANERVQSEAKKDSMSAETADTKLGTGHGEHVASHVTDVEFRRASKRPAEILTIYYDSRKNLIAQGIIPNPEKPKHIPKGFPAEECTRFVADPS